MMEVTDADGTVVGREHELEIMRSFCTDRNQPGAVLLEGDAGIGKTVLWEAGLAIASAAGHTVLRCRPAAAEAQLSFAALADLLVDVLDEALPALAAPQRRALEVALLLDDAEGSPPDVRALAGAFLGVLRHASSSASVLVAIDDVQWLDEPSRTVLEFAVRRLGVEPVGVLASRRGTGGEPPLGLGQALAPERLQQLALAPLSMGALHRLVQTRLGMALSRPVLRRLHAESGGNPFYALEIGRALQRRGSAPRSDEPLPVPPTLRQLVQERVAALPDRVRRLLELVAALYDRRIDRVHELAHGEGLDGAIDQAIAAGVLTVADDSVQFSHPLLAAGVYAGMGPERRRDVHRQLADRERATRPGPCTSRWPPARRTRKSRPTSTHQRPVLGPVEPPPAPGIMPSRPHGLRLPTMCTAGHVERSRRRTATSSPEIRPCTRAVDRADRADWTKPGARGGTLAARLERPRWS